MATPSGFPGYQPIADSFGNPTPAWVAFFLALYNSTGNTPGQASALLDTLTPLPGSMLFRGSGLWQGLGPGVAHQVLQTIAGFPAWGFLDGNSFGSQTRGFVFAGPIGINGIPRFRALVASDLPPVSGASFGPQLATTFFAGPGAGGPPTNPAFRYIALTDLPANIIAAFGAQTKNTIFAGPATGANAVPAFRAIVTADLPPGQIPGTITNDNANAGNFGEYIHSEIASGAAVALTTTVAKDITSISLTAGDWDVWANVATTAAVTTASGWINITSATDPTAPNGGAYASWGAQTLTTPLGMKRIEVPAGPNQTVYLSINATFAGAVSAYGFLGARRAR